MRDQSFSIRGTVKEAFYLPKTNVHSWTAASFVHVLLFDCLQCGGPILTAVLSDTKNLEYVDALLLELRCPCNWLGNQIGVNAKTHWIEPWDAPDDLSHSAR